MIRRDPVRLTEVDGHQTKMVEHLFADFRCKYAIMDPTIRYILSPEFPTNFANKEILRRLSNGPRNLYKSRHSSTLHYVNGISSRSCDDHRGWCVPLLQSVREIIITAMIKSICGVIHHIASTIPQSRARSNSSSVYQLGPINQE